MPHQDQRFVSMGHIPLELMQPLPYSKPPLPRSSPHPAEQPDTRADRGADRMASTISLKDFTVEPARVFSQLFDMEVRRDEYTGGLVRTRGGMVPVPSDSRRTS